MKKILIRNSILVTAGFALLFGGLSQTKDVKEKVSYKEPIIISEALDQYIKKNITSEQGDIVAAETAEATTEAVTETTTEVITQEITSVAKQEEKQAAVEEVAVIEEKPVELESSQVVANVESYLNVRKKGKESAAVVGKFYNGNVGEIVKKGKTWSKVQSGSVVGYVKNDYLLFGQEAVDYIEANCDQVAKVAAQTLNIREKESTDSNIVDLAAEGDQLSVLSSEGDWLQVARSDEVVGYVAKEFVQIEYVYENAVTLEEEAAMQEQEEDEDVSDEAQTPVQQANANTSSNNNQTDSNQKSSNQKGSNKKSKKSKTKEKVTENESVQTEPVKEESSSSAKGQEIADYAVQFVGNPYVYGGTSLTKGADCSGFVQSVYKNFGYSLSRTAASQSGDGKKVDKSDRQPGDLIFYRNYGHVAIYIGGDQVVHASSKKTGIKISSYDYATINKIVRIIK